TIGGGGSTVGTISYALDGAAHSQDVTVTGGGGDVHGVLTVETTAGGVTTWSFDPAGDVVGEPSFTFTATVTDADGDVASDPHEITITDGAGPLGGTSVTLTVDEKDLADGTQATGDTGGEDGNPDTVDVDTGTLSFTAGSDAIVDVRFGADTSGIT